MHTVVFGDSIAKGIVYTRGKIEAIENNTVKLISNYYHQKIDNISFYGQTLKRIHDKKIVDKYLETIDRNEPLFAIFALGGNDSDYDWKKVAENPRYAHESKTNLSDFENILIELVEKLKAIGAVVILTTIIPLDSKSYFEEVISKQGDPNQIMIFLQNDIENISRHQEKYSNSIIKCAQVTQTPLIDVRGTMILDGAMNKYMCDDGVHPNSEGYRYLAESAIKKIDQLGFLNQWKVEQ